jgi:hypothetical protein
VPLPPCRFPHPSDASFSARTGFGLSKWAVALVHEVRSAFFMAAKDTASVLALAQRLVPHLTSTLFHKRSEVVAFI